MPKAKSTWRVRKHRIVGEISYILYSEESNSSTDYEDGLEDYWQNKRPPRA